MDINSMTPASGRIIAEDGSIKNVVDILGGGAVAPVSTVVHDIESYSSRSGRVIGEDGLLYNLVDLLEAGGGGGTSNHALLSNLAFAASGHTGFASEEGLAAAVQKLDGKANKMELDVTGNPAPPALPRTNGWHIGANGVVQGTYNYGRAFFTSKEAALIGDLNSPELIAAWAIVGKQMGFIHVLGGEYTEILITDENGNPLDKDGNIVERTEYRPIPEGQVWWFSDLLDFYQTGEFIEPFPANDTFFSILDVDIESIMAMLGDTFALRTVAKDFTNVANELLDLREIERMGAVATGSDELTLKWSIHEFVVDASNLDDNSGIFVVGVDYYIYAHTIINPQIIISANSEAPMGFDGDNIHIRKIGGFHYGVARRINPALQPINAGGVTWGMDWELNVYNGIVPCSIWTLSHRPKCSPEGMVYLGNNVWVDIYQSSVDGAGGLISKHNILPMTGAGLNWYEAVEKLLISGKRLLTYQEFIQAAMGSPPGTSSGNLNAWTASAERTYTGYVERAVSSIGCRDCVGNVWEWLSDLIASGSGTEVWQDSMPGQGYGQMWLFENNNFRALLAGGSHFNGALCGARTAAVLYTPWGNHASFGARGACEGI